MAATSNLTPICTKGKSKKIKDTFIQYETSSASNREQQNSSYNLNDTYSCSAAGSPCTFEEPKNTSYNSPITATVPTGINTAGGRENTYSAWTV